MYATPRRNGLTNMIRFLIETFSVLWLSRTCSVNGGKSRHWAGERPYIWYLNTTQLEISMRRKREREIIKLLCTVCFSNGNSFTLPPLHFCSCRNVSYSISFEPKGFFSDGLSHIVEWHLIIHHDTMSCAPNFFKYKIAPGDVAKVSM